MTVGLIAVAVFVVALFAIPFELYVLRKRRTWYLYASLAVMGLNGILAASILITPPDSAIDAEFSAALSEEDRLLAAAYIFVTYYYWDWFCIIVCVAFFALFTRGKKVRYGNTSPVVGVALDAGPVLTYLGLLLGAVSVVQGYDTRAGPRQLMLQVVLGLLITTAIGVVFGGYRRARSRAEHGFSGR